jgi:hypothetical protein
MIGPKLRIYAIFALASLTCLLFLPADGKTASTNDAASSTIQTTRTALEKYQDPIAAVRDGYFSTVACIDFPSGGTLATMNYPAGGMGVHFLNPRLIGTKLDPAHPQVLIYQPIADKLHLVAAEWFVPLAPGGTDRPVMFGHPFYGPMMGHYPVMPAQLTHYDLHVWLWKKNSSGMFSPTNPDVKCPTTGYSYHDATPKMPMGSH